MTGRERVLAALAGAPADRRAFVSVLSLYGARLTGCPLPRYYRDAGAYAAGQRAVRDAFDPDVLFAPFALAALGASFGGELREFEFDPPNLSRPAADGLAALARLRPPRVDSDPHLAYLVEAVAELAREHGRDLPIAVALPPPMDLPALVIGLGPWLEAVLLEPAAAEAAVEALEPFFLELARALCAAGADLLVLPCALTSPRVAPRDVAERVGVPSLRRVLPLVPGPVVLHHNGAPVLRHLDLLARLPQVVAFALDAADDRARARAVLPPAAGILAGVDALALAAAGGDEVRRAARAVLDERRDDRRFVFATSGPDVPWHTPPAVVRALRDEIAAHGGCA